MSKIQTSNDFFKTHSLPLGKRQPSGAADKRTATALTLAAVRLDKDGKRRGFETVFDNIISRETVYCVVCGAANDKAAETCKLCFHSHFSDGNKFELTCLTCEKPFHTTEKRPLPPNAKHQSGLKLAVVLPSRKAVAKIGRKDGKIQVIGRQTAFEIATADFEKRLAAYEELTCKCFEAAKQQRRLELSQKAVVIRHHKNLVIKAETVKRQAAARLETIYSLNKANLSREQKAILSREKVRLLRIVCPHK